MKCILRCESLEDRSVPAVFDLTSGTAAVNINGAIFSHVDNFAGGGNANSFLDIQGPQHSSEQGYNTTGVKQFDTKQASAIHVSDVPVIWIDNVKYREFALDVSESANQNHAYLAINQVRLYVANSGSLSGYNLATHTLPGATQVYNMDAGTDNTVLLDGIGSGKIDMFFLVPDSVFSNANQFVYLYSQMGASFPGSANFPGFEADSSAEHWDIGANLTPISPVTDLTVAKTDFTNSVVAGTSTTYTITVTNNGPTAVTELRLIDALPPDFLNSQFQPSVGSYDFGTGLWTGLNLAAGQSVTMTLTGTINPSISNNINSITNTVTVFTVGTIGETDVTNNTAFDIDTIGRTGNLSIFKTDAVTDVLRGQSFVYTITVSNTGPSTAFNVPVVDNFPSQLVAGSWAAVATNGATSTQGSGSGNINDTVTLPPNSSVTYSVNVNVDLLAALGPFDNIASLTVPANFIDTNASDNISIHTDTVVSEAPTVDLAITKTDGVISVAPGSTVTYTIVVTNNGPSGVTGATVTDVFPPALLSHSFTVATLGGATSSLSGTLTGDISDIVNVPVGGSVTYTVTAQIDSAALGQLANTAIVTAPAGVIEENNANNIAEDIDTLTPEADLAVLKALTTNPLVAGSAASYTITVTNNGPSTVANFTLTDTLPGVLLNPVFTPSVGSYDTLTHVWETTLAPAQTVTMTVSGTINAAATVPTVTNIVTVATPAGVTDTNLSNNTASVTNPLERQVDLAVTKTGNATLLVPGSTVKYTIIVTNNGPSTVTSLTLIDTLPTQLLNPVFVPSTGSYNKATGAWTGLNLASGQSVSLTITAKVAANATGTKTNHVVISAPAGVTETNLANNEAFFTFNLFFPSKRNLLTTFLGNRLVAR